MHFTPRPAPGGEEEITFAARGPIGPPSEFAIQCQKVIPPAELNRARSGAFRRLRRSDRSKGRRGSTSTRDSRGHDDSKRWPPRLQTGTGLAPRSARSLEQRERYRLSAGANDCAHRRRRAASQVILRYRKGGLVYPEARILVRPGERGWPETDIGASGFRRLYRNRPRPGSLPGATTVRTGPWSGTAGTPREFPTAERIRFSTGPAPVRNVWFLPNGRSYRNVVRNRLRRVKVRSRSRDPD